MRAADDGDHLAEAQPRAEPDQLGKQRLAHTTPSCFRRQIDRILDQEPIGRAGAECRGIGVAQEDAVRIDRSDIGVEPLPVITEKRAAISASSGAVIS